MYLSGTDLSLSATDLAHFLGCRHRAGLDKALAMAPHDGAERRQWQDDPLLKLLQQRGLEHEARHVEQLRRDHPDLVDLTDPKASREELVARTTDAMRRGVSVIIQGALRDGPWFGKPDVIRRRERPSTLGVWSYEILDTKLARDTKAGTILQLGLYSQMLAEVQGTTPEEFHVVSPGPLRSTVSTTYRVDDYAAYFRLLRDTMRRVVALPPDDILAQYYPEPVDDCGICRWQRDCRDQRRADDHLSLVAGVSRMQRHELEQHGVRTLTSLAGVELPWPWKPRRGSVEAFERAHYQAQLQLESRDRTPPLHLLRAVELGQGLCRLPRPSRGDLFLDFEGDAFAAEHGREYLTGVFLRDDHGQLAYQYRWGFSDAEEKAAFEWLIDLIAKRVADDPEMHVYHYAPYEPAAMKRLQGRYDTRRDELDALLRAERFVDLYGVTRQALLAGIERYSIKNLEPLYAFERAVPLPQANVARRTVEIALQSGLPDGLPSEAMELVRDYNRDDCVSTLALRDWLEQVREQANALGVLLPRPDEHGPAEFYEPSERALQFAATKERLLAGLPADREARDDGQQARWLLAHLLEWHRNEARADWWEYFRLRELPEEKLLDEPKAIAGLAFVERVDPGKVTKAGKPSGSVVDRYRYPVQDMELLRGQKLQTATGAFGVITALDRDARTVDVSKSRPKAEIHPTAVFGFDHVNTNAQEDSLHRLAEHMLAEGDIPGAVGDLLHRRPPRVKGKPFDGDIPDGADRFAIETVARLAGGVLPIQGPPGAGKTHTGAEMICALVKSGKQVGVTANSHQVIRLLLEKVAERAAAEGFPVRLGHKCDDGEDAHDGGIVFTDANDEARRLLADREIDVLGGTSWMWAREEFASAVHTLFIDEAGQMSLANAVAVAPAAKNVVLLGDPRQLEQPVRGTHPDGVGDSALEHLIGAEHRTITSDRGIFLGTTWRLAPEVCEYTSELFYERRLHSRAGLERQRLQGTAGLDGAGLWLAAVSHEGNRNAADEEVKVVAALIDCLTTPAATWINARGESEPMTGAQVLVVAPYNAQVSRLAERLGGRGVRVGTVDKFQGQEAPVVIYSMATSTPDDAPRGMEFLYSVNRLNVATSRARCAAIVVASPALFEPECRSPRQMLLANGLCRFREMARPVGSTSMSSAAPSREGAFSSGSGQDEPAPIPRA